MTQEDTTNKIMYELIGNKIVSYENSYKMRKYIMQAYSIGFNERSKSIYPSRRVCQIDKNGDTVDVFDSMSDATRKTGIPSSNISRAVSGERNSAGGYFWKFKDI